MLGITFEGCLVGRAGTALGSLAAALLQHGGATFTPVVSLAGHVTRPRLAARAARDVALAPTAPFRYLAIAHCSVHVQIKQNKFQNISSH